MLFAVLSRLADFVARSAGCFRFLHFDDITCVVWRFRLGVGPSTGFAAGKPAVGRHVAY